METGIVFPPLNGSLLFTGRQRDSTNDQTGRESNDPQPHRPPTTTYVAAKGSADPADYRLFEIKK